MSLQAPAFEKTIKVTMSFGLAGIDEKSPTAQRIIHQADLAMYAAKDGGRNQIRVYSPDLASSDDRSGIDKRMITE